MPPGNPRKLDWRDLLRPHPAVEFLASFKTDDLRIQAALNGLFKTQSRLEWTCLATRSVTYKSLGDPFKSLDRTELETDPD
jgi:hypothetical protein